MTNKFYFFRSFAPENGSGMDRLCIGTTTSKSRKLLSLLFVLLLGVGQMWGAEGTTHNISVDSYYTTGVLLNNAASINAMTINNLSYPVKKVAVTCNYNKTTDGVTVSCTVNGTAFGSPQTIKTSTTTTFNFEGSSTSGDVVISFVNNTNASSKMGTFKVTAVVLTEGAAAGPSKTLSSIAVQTAPTKKKYLEGETFDPTGLVITRTYSDATSDTYAYAGHTSDFTFSPTTSTALSTSNTSVSITCGGKSTSQTINVYGVTLQAKDEDGYDIPSGGPGAPTRNVASITPAADANNYIFKEWQIDGATLGSSSNTKSNTITNPTKAVTVTAVYYKPITITYKANGSTFDTQTYAYGGTLAFPTSNPDGATYSCSGKTFTGWVAEANKDYSHASTAPTYATAGSSVTTVATYYAVFAEASGSGDEEWVATDLGDLTSSDVFVIADDTYAIPNDNGTTSAPEVTSITVVSDAITSEVTDNLKWNISGNSTDGYTFYPNGSTTTWLYCNTTATSKSNDNIRVGTGDRKVWLPNNSGYLVTNDSYTDRYLSRYNTQDFRGYTGTGNGAFEPVFYKLTSSVTYSNYETNCCTPLSSINGSVSLTQTTAALEWADLEHVSSWAVKYKEHSAQNWSDWNGAQATANSKRSVTITNLSCGTAYDFKIAASAASGYCDAEEVLEDKSTTKWNITYTLTNTVEKTAGPEQGANACGEISATFSKDDSYSFPDEITVTIGGVEASSSTDYDWDANEGELLIDAAKVTGNVVIDIEGVAPLYATIIPSPSAIDFESPKKGDVVSVQNFTLTGSNLDDEHNVTVTAPSGYKVSIGEGEPATSVVITPSSGSISATIKVTPITSTAGTYNGNISISTEDLESAVTVALTMTVQETYSVNFYVNGTKIDANSVTDIEGTEVTAPDDFSEFTDCSDFHFIGWATSAIAGKAGTTTKPSLVSPITEIGTANVDYYAVFAEGTPASTETIFSESLSSGISTTGWDFNNKCYTASSTVRMSTGSDPGVMTSPAISSLDGDAIITFEVKAWSSTENGKVTISASKGTLGTTNFTTSSSDDFEEVSSTLSGGDATTAITFTGTAGYRIYIKNVKVAKIVAENFSTYYTTCPNEKPVVITIEDHELAIGGSWIIDATTVPAGAVENISYSIKDDGESSKYVSLSNGVVTGVADGIATLVASIPASEGNYLANSVEFNVTVKFHGSITYEENGGSNVADVADATALPDPLPTTTKEHCTFDGWWTTSNFADGTEAVPGATLTNNVTLYAKWIELPKWSYTYDSNVDLVGGGTSKEVAKVKVNGDPKATEYDAVKAGSSNNTGTVSITLPVGASGLHFHAAAWAGKSCTIQIENLKTPNPTFELTADAGMKNSTPYTLEGDMTGDQYYSVTFNALEEATTVTFSKSGDGDNRFIIYGVNAIYPEITLDPATYDFENVRANQTKEQVFTISANENVSGTLSASIIEDASSKYSISAIEDNKVTVTFDPDGAEEGTFTAKLKITASNASVTADLSGTAISAAAPMIVTDKSSIAFGRIEPNTEASATVAVELQNIDENGVSAALSGDDAEKFALSAAKLTADGDLVITPTTSAQGIFAASLTLSAEGAENVVLPISMTVASKWATTYTSNVTVTTGESKKANINSTDYDAFKKAKAENATLTLPKGTQKLHLHVVAWNGEGGDVIISGSCFNEDKVIAVTDNAVVSGTGATYTFTEAEAISYYHEIAIDNEIGTGGVNVTVSKSGSRIVLFGVNQEGGTYEIENNANISTLPDNANIEVKEGVTLTVDADKTIGDLTVENGGTVVVAAEDAKVDNLVVEDGGTVEVAQDVTVETLVISTSLGSISGEDNTGGKSGQVTGSGSINATGDVFIQIELTQDEKASAGWYAFSLPFKVDALNGVYFGDKKLQNEKDYAIMAWHGEIRATGEYGWKKYREVMDPGVLYIITVGNTDYKTLRFKKVAGEAIVQAENDLTISAFAASGEGQQATDAGWNGIGNKSLQIMQQGSYATMQFLDHTDNAFKARSKDDVNILVGSAFFVQYGSGVGTTVSMAASTSGSIALAPARKQESIEKTVFEAKLKNAETGKTEDNLFFTAREDALNEYEAGRDVTKMSMGEAKCAQMFIPAYGTKLCAADFPLVNNQATYPLTLTIPTTGTYSISIKENENANIYLTKNGAIIWNLTKSPYTIELEQGTTEGYGLMLVKRAPQDVETVSGDASEAGVQKVVINDKVFILRGEQLFGIDGKLVK